MSGETHQDEEIRKLRSALRESQRQVTELGQKVEQLEKDLRISRRKLAGAWEQLEALRHSSSWQMTAPLRGVKSVLRRAIRR
ncbi:MULTISPECIES: methyltransferase [unclassified Actinobaculum]|uniref:methyltransferase n=1 Tax=unclassified Actinobaculum TaxID=2609299 RepID=UPI000D525FE5|nr:MULTISPECIES: methyltransferase [unclassified Actinobaculum]AWE41948.1 methyltransferase [Actinobaculum sp. 313]RTE50137.1 methyltransferase [Actinobaculum sp. 352]